MSLSADKATTLPVSSQSSSPRHIAIIMDGNGRWARRQGFPRVAGHRRGVDAVRASVTQCRNYGIDYLTLFAFSSENWKRPATEVRFLLDLLAKTLKKDIDQLHENNVRLRVIGDLSRFSSQIQFLVQNAIEKTKQNSGLNLTIAINYGGQWDLTQACQRIAQAVAEGIITASSITAEDISGYLSTADLPEPDLFIRTGGEQRISNFFLWQLAYTELYFTPTLWPDFDKDEFAKALDAFSQRQRRFGQTGEQVSAATSA